MKKFTLILWILFALYAYDISAQNAPVTIAPDISAIPNSTINIPVTVSGFNNIGVLSLTMDYNASVLTYQSFTNNSGFPGLTVNGTIPGSIIAGGFIPPGGSGMSLDDNDVLFTLIFSYLGGLTNLTWNDNGSSCEYADYPNNNPLNDSPTSNYYMNGSVDILLSTNAPLTTAPIIIACPGILLGIPVTVAEFFNIGALSLTLNFNSSVLSYQSFINNSGFPGLTVNGTIPGTIIAGGFIPPGGSGMSLDDNTVLFTLYFNNLGGSTDLTWSDNGSSCEYADYPDYNPLNDSPTDTYYINGSVESPQSLNAPITIAPLIISCPGILLDIPITVADFCNIGALSLTLNYNASVLSYQSFTNNSGFPGLTVNGNIPGSIMAGGFIPPGGSGMSLDDNAVLFTLYFNNLGGSTDLIWSDNGSSCEYADYPDYNPLNDSPIATYYINGSVESPLSGNAPVTTAPFITSCPGTVLDIPVTVSDFCNIGALSLTMNYNSSVLSYQSFTNNSGFPGLTINGSIPGKIIAGGYIAPGAAGISLSNNSVLFTLSFYYTGGTSVLSWFDDGSSCEYTDNLFNPLNDLPASDYYIEGLVTFQCSTEWNGNSDNDWFNSGNWTFGVPNQYIDAIIPFVNPNPYPYVEANAECYGLNIAAGASLNIKTGSSMTAYGDFINNGQFTIESSPTGDGSFIDNGTIAGSGTTFVQRYLESEKWHFISPPISNGVSGIFYHIYLRLFNEPTGTYSYIVPVNVPLIPMKGYEAWADDDLTGTTTVSYIGSLNTGLQSINNLTNTPLSPYRGYNLVGNPYPSAVDWDQAGGWIKTNLDNATYRWHPNIGNYASYINGTGVNGGTKIIPSGQGFFVHVSAGNSNGSLSVNNNARLHDNTPFLKSIEDSFLIACLRLKTFSELNPYTDETVIQFVDNATPLYDSEFDAYKMMGLDEAPQLYSITLDSDNLTVNTNPKLTSNIVIPVGYKVGISGIYTIEASELINFSSTTEIKLEDKRENIFIKFNDQANYTFFADPVDNPDRFNIHFLLNPASAETTTFTQEILIFSDGNGICLKCLGEGLLNGQLVIYDLLGKEISKKEIYSTNRYQEVLNNKGIYIVTFQDYADNKIYRTEIFLR